MSNRIYRIRQTAAVLMACGIIASLLPGLTVAQDLSSVEARADWVIEQRRGESIRPNAKFGAAIALARLALNPDDSEVIDRITHFYDKSYEENLSHNYAPVHLYPYYPDEFYVDYTAFRLLCQSPDRFNFIECYHPYWRSDDRAWKGLNSPLMQMAQHKGTAIALFNIPTADPWAGRGRSDWQAYRDDHFNNLIQEALVRYPESIDQKTEANGWIFLREGEVYIAIRPLKDYTIDTDYSPAGEEFEVVHSAFAQILKLRICGSQLS